MAQITSFFLACKRTPFQPRLSWIRGNENLLLKSHPSTPKARTLISIYLKHISLLLFNLKAHCRMNFVCVSSLTALPRDTWRACCPVTEQQELVMGGTEYHPLITSAPHYTFYVRQSKLDCQYLYFLLDCPWSRPQLIQGGGEALTCANKPTAQTGTGEFVGPVAPFLWTPLSDDQQK